ncbi:MAG: hypothetical protein QOJ62_2580 [Actinomycetota bacterium]|nr:hypothetical protein [Actinomycetota bacterium]
MPGEIPTSILETFPPQAVPAGSASEGLARDRSLVVIGGSCVAISVLVVLARLIGVLPSSVATIVVIVAIAVGLRVVLRLSARSASSPARAKVMTLVSTVGLGISVVTILAALPVTTRVGGVGPFLSDLLAYGWTLGALTIAAGPVRTLNWRAVVGTGLTGYLALTALARALGRPVVSSLGAGSVLATSVWVPLTELLSQLLPAIVLVVLVMRGRARRMSALDLMLIGAWSGAGFALYEDTQFGRGGVHWSAGVPFSLLFPSESASHGGTSMLIAGHAVWAGLAGLSLGVAILYRKRFKNAWLVAPIGVGVVLLEHAAVNGLSAVTSGGSTPLLEKLVVVLTLGGWLTSLLLVAGVAFFLWVEWRAVKPSPRPTDWWPLRPSDAMSRARQLATAQVARDEKASL